jgi:hypothetical protein
MACSNGTAVSQTPTQTGLGMLTFFDSKAIYLSAATTPTGVVNQALIFHEALHGFTGASDPSLLGDFGFNAFGDPSCKITEYLELKLWAGTISVCGN